ncbi:MAG: sodium-dependent transporter [Pseudomonadota bacterium]
MASTTPSASPPQWSSRFAFLMAAVGIAVGLGNLWRFPFQTGQNGGSAFVFIYLLCVAFIAWPILSAEIAFGRAKRLSAVGSTAALARDAGATRGWGVIGLVGALASFFVLSTYSNVAGQIMAFSLMSLGGVFAADNAGASLPLYNGPAWGLFWFTLFLGLTVFVVARGLKDGIERLVTVLMPIFFVLLTVLCAYALWRGAPGQAIAYLFNPRFDEITPEVVLAALGQAFFSIAVGSAGMITYGAYLDRKEDIAANAGVIAGADTLVAIVAGLMIFPIVFAFSLDPGAGMGLIFEALPRVFSGMAAGNIVGAAFFFLAFIAALTSSISMLLINTAVAEEWFGWGRVQASLIIGAICWFVGVGAIFTADAPELIDFIAGNVLLPLGGLLGALLAGWVLPREVMRAELHNASPATFHVWRFLIRWLSPGAVALILVFGIDAQFGGNLAALFGLNAGGGGH